MSPRLAPLARLLGLSVLCVGLSLGCGGNTTPPQPPPNPLPDAAASTVTVDRATQVRADGAERVSITVTVKQADGTPMQGRTVRVTVSGDGNTVTQPAGTTNASGVATASVVSTSAGSKQVTASVDTSDGPVALNARPTIEFISPRPTRVSFTAAALSATAGMPMAGLDVALVDAAGRTVTSATDEVTLALAAGPGGSTPQGTLTVRAVAGVARFTQVVLTRAGTGYQWRA
ncbi:MAG TPA: Ig-like domain-containing protein, partial [Myxococcus sp.]|nr:Ig-like domain-containing protein [Myxococcus sp.]